MHRAVVCIHPASLSTKYVVPEWSHYSREAYRTQWIQRRKTYGCWDSDWREEDIGPIDLLSGAPGPVHFTATAMLSFR